MISVDKRERLLIKELARRNLDFEEKDLPTDIIVSNIGIERKTQHDFLNSIIDKRIFEQLSLLKDLFDKQIIIIEGDENLYELRQMHPNAIRGMFAAISVDYQIPIVFTKNIRDTASFIELLEKRNPQENSLLKKKKPKEIKYYQQLIIETLPGVGPKLAKNLLKEFKSVRNIFNASPSELQKVAKIGKKKAKVIFELLNKEFVDD